MSARESFFHTNANANLAQRSNSAKFAGVRVRMTGSMGVKVRVMMKVRMNVRTGVRTKVHYDSLGLTSRPAGSESHQNCLKSMHIINVLEVC